MDEVQSITFGSEYEHTGPLIHDSLSFISVQSLSSARGSTPLIKRRRSYDASKSMENVDNVPIHRLLYLHRLHDCGVLKFGNEETDTKTRRNIQEYFKNPQRSTSNTIRTRRDFPSLRKRSKTFSTLRNQQLDLFQQDNALSKPNDVPGSKSVTFNLPKVPRPKTEIVVVKRPLVTVLQHNEDNIERRPFSDKLLLHRPTKPAHSIDVNDELIKSLAKRVQLKPLNFRTTNEQFYFYTQNFPLLLDAHADEKIVFTKRTPTPEMRNSPELRRDMKLNRRLNQLETSLDTLDKETEDVDFRTVLRDEVFYPNKWPWNEKKPSDLAITQSTVDF